MFHLPKFKRLRTSGEMEAFSRTYFQCSGFDVSLAYFMANQVFSIFWKGKMVGGFVLGTGEKLRTLEVFAGNDHRPALYQQVAQAEAHTEICCFWMDPATRRKTWLNFFVWCCVAYSLRAFGTDQLIFGTCSAHLARLYSATPKCRLLHSDCINQKPTFIYAGPRRDCLLGVGQILCYKLKRLAKLGENSGRQRGISLAA